MEDTLSIEAFYRAHAQAVYAFCVSLSRDRIWAEDLMQDTFARATRYIGGYRGGDPRSWLFAIARTVFLDDLRKHRPTPTDSVRDDLVEDRDMAEVALIEQVLSGLPERQRTALLLADHAGLPYEEVAQAVDATPSGVKVLIHRARANFKKQYEKANS